MKKIIASLFLLFLANSFYGQNKGITYQAVIYSPDAIVLPGQDNMLAPLTNQEVCMRFSFLDKGLTSEYEETITVITDGFGMVNLTLGQAAQSGGYASGFEQMTWEGMRKNLMVELDVSGNCFEFVEISNTTLSYVPFAMYAKTSGSSQINATNIDNNTAAIQSNTTAIALNTAKTGVTSDQATAIAANTAKTGITAEQSDAISVNTAKVGYTDELVSANTDVVGNTAKVGYTDELVSANTDVVGNTAKTGITPAQKDAITNNTAKVGVTTHFIGESYGGGIVFFVYDGGQHGLIAATEDQGTAIRWFGGTNTNTRARADGIGAGFKNTAIIIANQGSVDGNAFAATVCNEYSVTVDGVTYGDWYLPSKHELNLLYLQKVAGNVGGFSGNYYWSSTEYDANYSWDQTFSFGFQDLGQKITPDNVRAVRAF